MGRLTTQNVVKKKVKNVSQKRSHIWKGEIEGCCRSLTFWGVKSSNFGLRRPTLESICLSPVIFASTFFQDTLDFQPGKPPIIHRVVQPNGPKKAVPQNDSWGCKEWPKDPEFRVWKKLRFHRESFHGGGFWNVLFVSELFDPRKKARAKFLT